MAGRGLRLVLAALLSLPALAAGPHAPLHPGCAAADAGGRVAVVIEHGNGQTATRCLAFSGATISGDDALNLLAAVVEVRAQSFGGNGQAICQVDNEPATYGPDCFSTPDNRFWSLSVWRHGGVGWSGSQGISRMTYASGDAIGMRYDPQNGAQPPPDSGAAGICPAAATAVPPPARTPSPTPTHAPTAPPTTHPSAARATPTPPDATAAVQLTSPPATATSTPAPLAVVPAAATSAPSSATSTVGWALLSLILTAGVGVLVTQLWRRSRTP